MKHTNGFTLIELIIVLAILGFLTSIIVPAIMGTSDSGGGIIGNVETRCIDGYKFVVGQDGVARQFMDEHGRGIRCQYTDI